MTAAGLARNGLAPNAAGGVNLRGGRQYRSMLFVPGNRPDWMRKAGRYAPDALVLELEDAVPIELKASAREAVGDAIRELAGEPFGRFVRTNGWRTGQLLLDLDAIVVEGLDGIVLSKVEGPEDIVAADLVLDELETSRGLPPGTVEIFPLTETARGIHLTHEVCLASPRVKRCSQVIVATPGGDYPRSMNLTLSPDGRETIPVGQVTALAARAAGLSHVMGAITTEVDNLDLVRRLTEHSKRLGATGALTVHPSHVPILNELYAPSDAEIEEARMTLEAMADAIGRGLAAVRVGRMMVDYAHVRSALDVVESARGFGIDVGDVPDITVFNR